MNFHLKYKKGVQSIPDTSRTKELKKIRAESNKTESRETREN